MTEQHPLFLHEEILLLALQDAEGTIASGTWYQQAIGGAILAELLLSSRIRVDESGKRKLVELISSKPVGDPLIDECLEKVVAAKRRASPATWIGRFAAVKGLKNRLAEQLCRRGILRADEKTVLLIFTRRIFPEIDPEPERKLIERLCEAIFSEASEVDPRTVVLVSLANGTGLLDVVFDKKKLKAREQRIESIVNGEVTGKAAKEAVEAAQAAIMVAVILPTMMNATFHHH